jgi:2-phospho-L-lactate transferase/gluconeogenesis factor (CofD/UPF0052 family)
MNNKITIFAGGRGSSQLFQAIKFLNFDINIIVNAYDNGLSTGILRKELDILGISDIRKNIGMVSRNPVFSSFLEERIIINRHDKFVSFNTMSEKFLNSGIFNSSTKDYFKLIIKKSYKLLNETKISGDEFAFGNLLLISLFKSNNINKEITKLLNHIDVNDRIIINSYDNLFLIAITRSGHLLLNEEDIVGGRSSIIIEDIFLVDSKLLAKLKKLSEKNNLNTIFKCLSENSFLPKPTFEILDIIKSSDYIFYSTGTPHSSLYPSYLTCNIGETICNSNAIKILISNIGADYETPCYKSSDYIKGTLKYLQKSSSKSCVNLINYAIVNQGSIIDKHQVINDCKKTFLDIEIISDYYRTKKTGEHNYKKLIESLNKILNK